MEKINQVRHQAAEQIERYFSGALSAEDLRTWALAHPTFANPKELDNNEDWIVSNALALMIALTDTAADPTEIARELQEAKQFLTGETPFPEDRWPQGLLRSTL